jgi:2-polyprenyl-3-methyl-5-hydroxy-6-metoxy-1,4-benzoquinol methylase
LLKSPDEPESTYPLDLVFCPECSLVQIKETVDPKKIFNDYKYRSSGSRTMLKSAADLVENTIRERGLNQGSLVVEIGSNDGYLLKNYVSAGIPVLGIDPCKEIADVAVSKGVSTIVDYFSTRLVEQWIYFGERTGAGQADVIHANNVLAHVPDINDFVEGISILLKPDGIAIIETPYTRDMIDRCEFDTIYHEHVLYYSIVSLITLFHRHGLHVNHIEHLDIHGGSLRVTVGKSHETLNEVGRDLLVDELYTTIHRDYYKNFSGHVEKIKHDLVNLLSKLREQGKRIVGYAASAKGSTLMNYCGIGQYLDYVVDNTPAKQGLYTPGTHLEIFPPEKLLENQPDYALLLAWNFADEIMEHEQEYIKLGGRFIIPIPKVRIV